MVNGTIEVTWGDGGLDTDYLTMKVYDIDGNLIDEVNDSGITWQTFMYDAIGAHKLVFESSNGAPPTSDTFVDQIRYPTPGPAFNLVVSGPCPGKMNACVSGATPYAKVGFAYGFVSGSTPVPPCPGLTVNIKNAKLAGLANANSNGDACISGNVPAGACGRAIVQAVDLDACVTSNVAGT